MKFRDKMIEAMKEHARGHIAKHKMNVEIYLQKAVGVGEHSDILETMEKELGKMAEYHDQLEVLDKYFENAEPDLLNEDVQMALKI